MRKSVKLAAASTLAAVAMMGASATAASANEKDDATNVCGNSSQLLASAKDNGKTEGDVYQTGESHQVICQKGKENYAVNYYEGDVVGGDLVSTLTKTITNTISLTATA
jgi:hypothetical protein